VSFPAVSPAVSIVAISLPFPFRARHRRIAIEAPAS